MLLKYNLEIFAEKYVNVAKRFHYVEDKIRRKDAERLTAEKTILETLEKLNTGQEKIQKMVKSNEDSMNEIKESKITEQENETKFKETLKRYFKVEAQLLKVRFKLRWIFHSMPSFLNDNLYTIILFRPNDLSFWISSSTSIWRKITYCWAAMKTQTWPK